MQDIKELVKYSVTDEALEQYRKEFLPLTIAGITDHEGYARVKDARLFIKGERVVHYWNDFDFAGLLDQKPRTQ